jgi:hypothetical protein
MNAPLRHPTPRVLAATIGIFLFTAASASADEPGHEIWSDCDQLPPLDEIGFLPIFLPTEEPGFVDLGTLTVEHAGATYKALQYSRDKDFGTVQVPSGTWLTGAGGDEWPAGTVDVASEMRATRVVSWEIDGVPYKVTPACFLDLSSEEGTFGLYNVWVRFDEPGTHVLRITLEQKRNFYFVHPYDFLGIPDPAGLEGRRVFLQGEVVGDDLDGRIVHSYVLDVQP